MICIPKLVYHPRATKHTHIQKMLSRFNKHTCLFLSFSITIILLFKVCQFSAL